MRTVRRIRAYFGGVVKFLFHSVGMLLFKPLIGAADPRSLDRQAPRKILYVCLAYRGDFVINFPAICALRKHFQNSHITCWVRGFNESLARMNPDIGEVIVYDDFSSNPIRTIIESMVGRRHLGFVKGLRLFDIYMDDSGYAFTALAGFLAKIPLRVGRNFQGLGFLNHFEVPLDQNSQLIERRLKLLKVFGVNLSLDDIPKPYFKVDANVRDAILRQYGLSHLNYFTVQPFAGWEAKNWGMDRYVRTATIFASRSGLQPVFVGSASEKSAIDGELREFQCDAVNLAGTAGLDQAAIIISGSSLHMGGDSIGGHLAAAFNVPSVTIFGPTNPHLSAYLGGRNVGVFKKTQCTPKRDRIYCCFDAGRGCPRISCMKELSEDDVLRVLIDVWTGKEQRPVVEL